MKNIYLADQIANYIGEYKSNGLHYVQYKKCPFCGNDHWNLEVNVDPEDRYFGRWHCWACDTGGYKITSLFKRLNYHPDIIEKFSLTFYNKSYNQSATKKDDPLKDYISAELSSESVEYLSKRHISLIDIKRFKIKYSPKHKKVLFPFYDSNLEFTGFLTRKITFKNYYKSFKNNEVIPNEHLISWSQEILLVEGIFDSIITWKAGVQSIPLLGNFLSKNSKLFKKIKKEKPIITIFLDKNAMKKAKSIARLLFLNQIYEIYLVKSDESSYEDINKMGVENFLELYHKKIKVTPNLLLE